MSRDYRWNEGTVRLPDGVLDLSVQELRLVDRPLTIFVSRLPTEGLSLPALVARRANDLRRRLPGYRLRDQAEAAVDGVPAFVFEVELRDAAAPIVQWFAGFVVGETFLTLGVSGPTRYAKDVRATFSDLLASVRLRREEELAA